MKARIFVVLLCLFESLGGKGEESLYRSGRFLVYRTVSVTQKPCDCPMSFSCTCCRVVIILYTKAEKNFCVNFTYQSNGFNIDVTLNSDIIKARTLTVYKPLRFCVFVPGCLFSSACINVIELNQFPRSITACLRLDIYNKKKLWKINYDCVSISTELPMVMMNNATTRMVETPAAGDPGGMMEKPAQMPITTAMQPQMPTMVVITMSSMAEITTTQPEMMTMTETMAMTSEMPPAMMHDDDATEMETDGMNLPSTEMVETEITMAQVTAAPADTMDSMTLMMTAPNEMPTKEMITST